MDFAGVDVLVYAIVVATGVYLIFYWHRVAKRKAEKRAQAVQVEPK